MLSSPTEHRSAEATDAPRARRLIAAVLIGGALMDMVDASIVNVALPSVARDLGASATAVEWLASGYLLAFAAVLVVAGVLGDRYGRKRLFVLGTVLFGAASLGGGLAGDVDVLVACRIAQGAAAATMVPQVLASFRVLFPREERAAVLGVYGATLGLASAVGVALGGVIVDPQALGWGWRGTLLVNVPVAVVVALLALQVVPEHRDERPRRPDLAGGLLLVASVVALVLPLLEGRRLGWPAWLVAVLVAGVAGLAAVVALGARRRPDVAPLLPAGLLRVPAAAAGLLVQLLFSVALQGLLLSFALFLQGTQGASPLRAGLTLLAFSAGGMLTAPWSGVAAERHGRRVLVGGAALLVAGVLATIWGAHAIGDGPGPWPLVPGLVAGGAGLCLLVVPLVNVVLATVPASVAGSASGVFTTAQQLGGAIGIATIGGLFLARDGLAAFDAAAAASAAGFALCGLLCLALPRTALSEADAAEAMTGG